MKNKLFRVISVIIIIALMLSMTSCKKKKKHDWREVGVDYTPQVVTPGVHPERGSDSSAAKVVTVNIYYPRGRDDEGKPRYGKYLYDLEELTPEAIDQALKNLGIIDETSIFKDLVIEDADKAASAGPGATDKVLTKKGKVRYIDLSSSIDNSDEYAGKFYGKDLKGMINQDDIFYSITQTFEENFQLVSCEMGTFTEEELNEINNEVTNDNN